MIARNVDVGQTVAASLSAPTLFLIANDLSRMQILANVDEGDIGQIKAGQAVRFTVQAFPGRTFTGQVSQVRLQPATIQNVVNYTVVIEVSNEEGLLLPGMTATVDFLLARAAGVLKVANAALRFRPTPQMLAQFRQRREQAGERNGGGEGGSSRSREQSRLWYVDAAGQVQMVRVKTGISDGQMTEVEGEGVGEGREVISGVLASSASSTATSPFAPAPAPDRRMRF